MCAAERPARSRSASRLVAHELAQPWDVLLDPRDERDGHHARGGAEETRTPLDASETLPDRCHPLLDPSDIDGVLVALVLEPRHVPGHCSENHVQFLLVGHCVPPVAAMVES